MDLAKLDDDLRSHTLVQLIFETLWLQTEYLPLYMWEELRICISSDAAARKEAFTQPQ